MAASLRTKKRNSVVNESSSGFLMINAIEMVNKDKDIDGYDLSKEGVDLLVVAGELITAKKVSCGEFWTAQEEIMNIQSSSERSF